MIIRIVNLENERWTPEVGPTINDPVATAYSITPTPNGLVLSMNSNVAYGGWLAKNVIPLVNKSQRITFFHSLMIDDSTLINAQVIETDFKVTDDQGWTYDLSAQWNIAKNWLFQVDNEMWTWRDTNVQIAPMVPGRQYIIEIAAQIDYVKRLSSILSVKVNGTLYSVTPAYSIPARQEGWAHSEIVGQLQQCNNSKLGGYTLRFSSIGYELA